MNVNTSGSGIDAVVPTEVKGWNWGAFLLNWIWGVSNNTYLSLLMFVPLVNVFILFLLGAKGNEMAWRNKKWESVEKFKSTQRKWMYWGIAVWAISGIYVIHMTRNMSSLIADFQQDMQRDFKSHELYQLSINQLKNHKEVAEKLGVEVPLTFGGITGKVSTQGPLGDADFAYAVHGAKGNGMTYVKGQKEFGKWQIVRMRVVLENNGAHIVIKD